MKKSLLMTTALLFAANTAFSMPVWFDPDGAGAAYSPILVTELNGNSSITDISQTFGADGVLNNGDLSYEDLTVQIGYADGDLLTKYFAPADIKASVTNLEGQVVNFSGAVVDDSMQGAALVTALASTSYGVSFTPGQTISLTQGATLIGDFSLIQGGTDTFVSDLNSSATSEFGIDLITSALAPGYFFLDNGGTIGADWSQVLLDNIGEYFFLAIADSSVELEYILNADTGDNIFSIGVRDNGTGITFAAVPEPSTFLLLGAGLLGIGFIARRKEK